MDYEVIIAGGGMVGSALACLLGQAGKRVAVLEAAAPAAFSAADPFDVRVSALSRASQRMLLGAGAWGRVLAMRAAPYERMQVWDATGSGQIGFDAADLGEPDLGHIVENRVLQLALLATLADYPTVDVFCPARLESFACESAGVTVLLQDGRQLQAQLLVGADGAQSVVRHLAQVPVSVEDYGQKGLVCTVQTALPHADTAWQRFLPGGPLAFLPLPEAHHCSIVWTLPADRADAMLALDEPRFCIELAQALEGRLGAVVAVGERAAFPLRGMHAGAYVQERIALLGDAAHTIHPLAGQGVNLGFKDAAELASQLLAAQRADWGSLKVLRRYERARRGDNLLTQKAMEGFRLLFGNTVLPLQVMRNIGLDRVNHFPLLKYPLVRQAMGV